MHYFSKMSNYFFKETANNISQEETGTEGGTERRYRSFRVVFVATKFGFLAAESSLTLSVIHGNRLLIKAALSTLAAALISTCQQLLLDV